MSVQFDLNHWIDLLRAGVGMVPAALIAMFLLGGPTAAWLLYRFVVQPRSTRLRNVDRSAMWICPSCRSVNALRLARCYRCDTLRIEEEIEVIDTRPTGPVRLMPVGPGLDLGGPGRAARPRPLTQIERAEVVWAEDTGHWVDEIEEDQAVLPEVAAMPGPVPVGPGRPAVTRPTIVQPRRAVVAGPTQDPDDTPAA